MLGLLSTFGTEDSENSCDMSSARNGMDVAAVLDTCTEPAGAEIWLTVDGLNVDGDAGMSAVSNGSNWADCVVGLSRTLDEEVCCAGGMDRLGTPEVGILG